MITKIFSKHLNKEIELDVEDGFIKHDSLVDYIVNGLADRHIRYDLSPKSADAGVSHPYFQCVMQDAERRITTSGEASTDTLTTDLHKQYPATTAANRAFDSAAILYLGLPGKYISAGNESTVSENVPSAPVAAMVSEPANAPAPVAENASEAVPGGNPWDEVYDSGKFKGMGKTYAQIADEAPDYAKWFVDKGRNREAAEIFKAYLATKE